MYLCVSKIPSLGDKLLMENKSKIPPRYKLDSQNPQEEFPKQDHGIQTQVTKIMAPVDNGHKAKLAIRIFLYY
ncbi:MAG: hypothetical protein IPI96_02735 [Saprospiraceae bacterium]|nr:hypothetical protein [Saprospiraceae bacterium]